MFTAELVARQHLAKVDGLGVNHAPVALGAVVHEVANEHGRTVEEGVPVLCGDDVELPFGGHHGGLSLALGSGGHPRDAHEVEQTLRLFHHLWRIMHDAGGHLLSQGKIASRQGLFVNGFGFQTASASGSHLIGLEFG